MLFTQYLHCSCLIRLPCDCFVLIQESVPLKQKYTYLVQLSVNLDIKTTSIIRIGSEFQPLHIFGIQTKIDRSVLFFGCCINRQDFHLTDLRSFLWFPQTDDLVLTSSYYGIITNVYTSYSIYNK